jgi:hypothetical protein
MPDAFDQQTLLEGAKFRFLRAHEKPSVDLLQEFRDFVRDFIVKNFDPIPPDSVDAYEYIEGMHHPQKIKDRLKTVLERTFHFIHVPFCFFTFVQRFVKSMLDKLKYKAFGKVERYKDGVKYKHARCINPAPDEWKVFAGPFIHALEKVVCATKWFAKYIPVIQRPRHIIDRFSGKMGLFYCTDYTSFESSFSPNIIDATEGQLYSYMLSNYPHAADVINRWNSGDHVCKFKGFTAKVPGVRMSGDPNTSIGNGFTNLMLTAFMAHKCGLDFDGIVEGDDGLFVFSGEPDFTIVSRLGFQLKLEPHDTIYRTSFCGMMLSQSGAAFADPRYVLASFGWTHSQFKFSCVATKMGLLRAKALSLMYCNPRCPILTALARRFIDLTGNYNVVESTTFWDQQVIRERIEFSERIQEEYNRGITMEDRQEFSDIYHIPVAVQIEIEKYLQSAELAPLSAPCIDGLYGDDYWVFRDFSDRYAGPLSLLRL